MKRKIELLQESPRPTVLIVEDDPILRDLCTRTLSEYRVLATASGAEALQVLAREKADLVLTDVMMPGMSGLDLLQTIKERAPNQAVVVMTGLSEKEVILRALRADADDFINKPIDLLQLRTTVGMVLEKVALRQELLELRRLDRLKSDFLGLISHKLKTPVTAISLFIQNLAQGIGNPEDPSFRRTLSLILKESDYLEGLIKDLLHYSEILLQEGPPQLLEDDPVSLTASIAVEEMKEARGKGVCLSISLGTSVPLPLDRPRLSFALRALLDNAVKFTPAGGEVEVKSRATGDALRLIVRDSGPGIPREELPKVFEKFYQVDPQQTGQVRGFGLGLFYARQFVQEHGGTLRLECPPGKGTLAVITLPRP